MANCNSHTGDVGASGGAAETPIPRLPMAALGADPAAFARAMAETGFVVLTEIGEGEKLHRDMMADFAAFMASRYRLRCPSAAVRALP